MKSTDMYTGMGQQSSKTRVERQILKYFNLLLAVLMLVVFSLNLEQISHNRRIFQPENHNIYKIDSPTNDTNTTRPADYPLDLFYCLVCQETALRMLNQLNSINQISLLYVKRFWFIFNIILVVGAILSLLLALYSGLFAFKADLFDTRFMFLVPECVLVCILTFIYFIKVLFSKLVSFFQVKIQIWNLNKYDFILKNCVYSFLFPNIYCDLDFNYSMQTKIIPLSVLMVAIIPQVNKYIFWMLTNFMLICNWIYFLSFWYARYCASSIDVDVVIEWPLSNRRHWSSRMQVGVVVTTTTTVKIIKSRLVPTCARIY